jgi:hypothetical protein
MQTLVLLALTAAILMVAAGQTVMIFTALYGNRKKPEKPVSRPLAFLKGGVAIALLLFALFAPAAAFLWTEEAMGIVKIAAKTSSATAIPAIFIHCSNASFFF